MMFTVIRNNKGNIGIAIVLAIIAVLSGVSMASLAFRDTLSFRNQLDAFQQLHFLSLCMNSFDKISFHNHQVENW